MKWKELQQGDLRTFAVVFDKGGEVLGELRGFAREQALGASGFTGIGAFSRHHDLALEALRCITTQESMTEYMLSAKNPSARGAVYDDPDVRAVFPMADLIRQSIQDSAPRPKTPYYTDVSSAVVRSFHPAGAVRDDTPARAARLIVDVLHDKVLL